MVTAFADYESKSKSMCRWDGGGGPEIPKGGRAGRVRSLGIWPLGWAISRGGEIPGTPGSIPGLVEG